MSVSRKAVRKETLDDIGERIEELMRLTNPVRHVMRSGTAAVLLPIHPRQAAAVTTALSCIICKGKLNQQQHKLLLLRQQPLMVSFATVVMCSN